MKILKVSCTEHGISGRPITYEIDTTEISIGEFAELKFLIDLSRIMESRNVFRKVEKGSQITTITITTKDKIYQSNFTDNPPEEIQELFDFIKSTGTTIASNKMKLKLA